ncbi:hypothetical protein F5887DRAFT_912716 [Amanita rubescens]|nr:hypothetical protein F5887DRAFT_912716 [Amanita rubescens]
MVMRTLSLRIWFRVTGCNRRVRDDAKLCYHASGLIGQLGGETKLLPQVKKTASVLRKIKFMLEEGLFRAFVGAPKELGFRHLERAERHIINIASSMKGSNVYPQGSDRSGDRFKINVKNNLILFGQPVSYQARGGLRGPLVIYDHDHPHKSLYDRDGRLTVPYVVGVIRIFTVGDGKICAQPSISPNLTCFGHGISSAVKAEPISIPIENPKVFEDSEHPLRRLDAPGKSHPGGADLNLNMAFEKSKERLTNQRRNISTCRVTGTLASHPKRARPSPEGSVITAEEHNCRSIIRATI